ncbi:MAG: hypothetical protein M0P93_08895 [Candidatus Cloacimonetes bacterium]|nr:hypothetical protein [Candidatus Cloacimonadota bacterium]
MAEGRARDEWSRWSVLLAMFCNANRNPKKTKPFTPGDFNPYAIEATQRTGRENQNSISELRSVLEHRLGKKQ